MKFSQLYVLAAMCAVAMCAAAIPACIGDDTSSGDGSTGDGSDATTNDALTDSGGSQDAEAEAEAEAAAPFDANAFGNLELWIRADDITFDGGTAVTAWTDRSLQQRALTSTTLSQCDTCSCYAPILQKSAIHGLPIAVFNGQNDCMNVSGAFPTWQLGFTSFAIFQPGSCGANAGGAGGIFDSHDGPPYVDGIAIHRNPSPANVATGDGMLSVFNTQTSSGATTIVGGSSWVPAQAALLEFRLPAASANTPVSGLAYVNDTMASLGENDPIIPQDDLDRSTTTVGYYANGGQYGALCGGLGELLVYSKALSDGDRQSVELYLKQRWGL